MKTKLTVLAALAALVVAVPVYAQDAAPEEGEGMMRAPMGGHGARMMERFDSDDDGSISPDEFADMRIGDIIGADADGDGELSFEEIKAAVEQRRESRMEEMLKRRFDIDGDGTITVAELRDRQDKRFALLDADDDGSISQDEFRRMHREFGGKRGGNRRMHHGMGGRSGWEQGRGR